jgi:hypothetical protein
LTAHPWLLTVIPVLALVFALSGLCHAQEKKKHHHKHGDMENASGKDGYSQTPFADSYEARRKAYLEYTLSQNPMGPFGGAVRVAAGQPFDETMWGDSLDVLNARIDCADFQLAGVLRLLYTAGDSPLLKDTARQQARDAVLNFKYWPDEPGTDSMCTWSENHYIMFTSGAYLAAQLCPDEVFTNTGRTGRERMPAFRDRILRWLHLRYQTGFSEWLSNVYYVEDLTALMNLVDFCQDEEIRQRATMVTDLLIADMALNSFRGSFCGTHGRSYEHEKKRARSEGTNGAFKVLFGTNHYFPGDMAATCLALSTQYRLPRVLYDIANDADSPEMINEQRAGIRLLDAEKYGLKYDRLEDGMLFFAMEAYAHPKTIGLTLRMLDAYHWWGNEFFESFARQRGLIETASQLHLLPLAVWFERRDVQRNQREEANIYTCRTPDYLLSTAQDYKRGYGGDQQHVWQATLGPGAACFTTHPAKSGQETPNYWTGSGTLPRVAQVKNVVIAVYRITGGGGPYVKAHPLMFTHAWLPKDQFDEVVEHAGWVFARRGDGYLALWSRQPWRWQTEEGDDKDREIIAPGQENIWICELGRKETDGEFASFMENIAKARVFGEGLQITYESPSQGPLEFGWNGSLKQRGRVVNIADYPRYNNPYAKADFPAGTISFQRDGKSLLLDWDTLRRDASAWCE